MPTELELSRSDMTEVALRLCPRASPGDVLFLGDGQLSMAVLVDGVVVRFPRSEFAAGSLRRDVSVLERIRPVFGDLVPEVLEVDLDARVGRAFVAHRQLPGSPLTPQRIEGFDPATLRRIGEGIAHFLRELHALAPAVADLSLPTFTNDEFARSLQIEVERWLAGRMSVGQRERAGAELGALGRVPSSASALCHSDIGGNVLYDDASGALAFIDFGSAMIADPVLDFASLSVLGPELLLRGGDVYPLLHERSEDAAVIAATFLLQDALYGARQGDWLHVDEVLACY